MHRNLLCFAILFSSFISLNPAFSAEIKVGVLGHRSDSLEMWSPLVQYLSEALPHDTVSIKLYDNQTLDMAVRDSEIDFVLTNPGAYIGLEYNYGITRIATLKNLRQGSPYTQFGSVLFTLKDRDDINNLSDLKGKSFAAVAKTAFGGFLIGARELKDAGVDPFSDLAQLHFTGLPQGKIITAVANGKVDAGVVRTDTLERLNSAGKININDFKVLNQKQADGFPFLLSSRLYPEWPFAKAKHTSDKLAKEVVIALLQLPEGSLVAKAAKSAGWTVPLDYSPVHQLYQELHAGPYVDYGRISMADILKIYWHWVVITIAILLILTLNTFYVYRLNKSLRESQVKLMSTAETLERSNKQLETLSSQDGLTQLANRRFFNDQLGSEWSRAIRNKKPISLLMCDIDYFKLLNDSRGHLEGDQCLKEVAKILTNIPLRSADIVARYGGEEFVLLLPETDLDGAINISGQVHENLVALSYPHDKSPIRNHVTVSIGLTSIVPQQNSPVEVLISQADQALYAAKEKGRNRTEIFTDQDSSL